MARPMAVLQLTSHNRCAGFLLFEFPSIIFHPFVCQLSCVATDRDCQIGGLVAGPVRAGGWDLPYRAHSRHMIVRARAYRVHGIWCLHSRCYRARASYRIAGRCVLLRYAPPLCHFPASTGPYPPLHSTVIHASLISSSLVNPTFITHIVRALS